MSQKKKKPLGCVFGVWLALSIANGPYSPDFMSSPFRGCASCTQLHSQWAENNLGLSVAFGSYFVRAF